MKRLALLALLSWLAACDAASRSSSLAVEEIPEAERYGGTAVVVSPQDLGTLYPVVVRDQVTQSVLSSLLLLPVLTIDAQLEPAPGLAKSWEIDADSTELTFHLRDDVYWHDGVRTTAHDLEYGYRLFWEGDGSGDKLPEGEAVVVDSFTFRVKMYPYPGLFHAWSALYAMPRHLLQGIPLEQMEKHPYWNDRMVGNGPFRVASRTPGQSWTFEANPHFPRALGGRPFLDRVILRIAPDPDAGVAELLGGRADYLLGVQPEQAEKVSGAAGTRLLSRPSPSYVFISWNGERTPFHDVRVRRALTRAIDREGIVDRVLHGHGQVANASVPPFHWAHDASVGRELAFDPDAARTLLEEAGWEDRDGDGTLENDRGEPFRLVLATIPTYAALARVVQSDLRRVGIDLRPEIQEFHSLVERMGRRGFDAVLLNLFPSFYIDDRGLFHCAYRDLPLHTSGYCDPEADRIMDSTQVVADRSVIRSYWVRHQQKIAADQPFTFLFFEEALTAATPRLQGVRPDVRGDWSGVTRWWILPHERDAVAPTAPHRVAP